MKSRVGLSLLLVVGGLATSTMNCGSAGDTLPSTGSGGSFETGGSTGAGDFVGTGGTDIGVACDGTTVVGAGGDGVPLSVGFSSSQFPPNLGTTYSQAVPPPAISGGTLLLLADGHTVVASDPDRDVIYVVDLTARAVTFTITLTPGDEPGRLVQDGAGHVQVALRHGGALVTCDPTTGTILARRSVCAAPRGLAYDPATDLVHVACHDGSLVSLPAAGGAATRTLQLDDDLRDVVVSGTNLLVTRFRSAELLTVAADGTVSERVSLPAFSSTDAHGGGVFSPNGAWRTLPRPGGGVAILHQRGLVDPVMPSAGGYGGPNPCDTIVHPAITCIGPDGSIDSGPALAGLVLAVDMAISSDGQQVAVISSGNATNTEPGDTTPVFPRVFLTDLASATDQTVGCVNDGQHAPCLPTGVDGIALPPLEIGGEAGSEGTGVGGAADGGVTTGVGGGCAGDCGGSTGLGGSGVISTGGCGDCGSGGFIGTGGSVGSGGFVGTGGCGDCGTGGTVGTCQFGVNPPGVPPTVGQPIAVVFDSGGNLVVQSREPAMLAFADGTTLTLSTVSREDTGHTLFHANSGGFLACASCHSEGNEDGRTWNFMCEGPRRTQSVQTGLQGTEPFHWDGMETDFNHLMTDVFVGRMSGPTVASDQQSALLTWLDGQPRAPKPTPPDAAAVARGQALFTSPTHACSVCHSGPHMTNNLTMDVGTGGMFQVPSLIGVGSRAPYLHNGCALTLEDRFGSCGGGDQHGITSTLSPQDVSDLVAYLKTL